MSLKGNYRYEQKYLIKKAQHIGLRQIFSTMVERDRHAGETGKYMIWGFHSDNMYHSTYWEGLNGVYAREKYRIRVYSYEDTIIHLECKHKQEAYMFKELVPLRREGYNSLPASDLAFLLKREEPIAKESSIDARTVLLRPEVVVDYEREPYIYDMGTVRITFDRKVRAGRSEDDIFDDRIPTYGVLRPDGIILGIKLTGYLPERTRHLFYVNHFTQAPMSEYRLCADEIREYRQQRRRQMTVLASKTTVSSDLFRRSFLKPIPQEVNLGILVVTLLVTPVLGLGIFMTYRECLIGVVYNHSFSLSLVVMTALVSVIAMTISSNTTLPPGMVGTLSIVRYRAVVRSLLDLIFMLWAVTMGVAVGTHYYYIVLLSFPFVALAFFLLKRRKGEVNTYVIIVNYVSQLECEESVRRVLKDCKNTVKSKIMKCDNTGLTVEILLRYENLNLLSVAKNIEDVNDATSV